MIFDADDANHSLGAKVFDKDGKLVGRVKKIDTELKKAWVQEVDENGSTKCTEWVNSSQSQERSILPPVEVDATGWRVEYQGQTFTC